MPDEKKQEIIITPELNEYIGELRKEVKKARQERDELKKQLGVKPPPDIRTLSQKDYAKAKAEMRRNLVRQEQEQKNAVILANLTNVDVRELSPDEYRQLQKKLARRG